MSTPSNNQAMTVGELRDYLADLEPDMPIILDIYACGQPQEEPLTRCAVQTWPNALHINAEFN